MTPLLVSGNIKGYNTPISFLGSILEKVVALPESPQALDEILIVHKIRKVKGLDEEKIGSISADLAPGYVAVNLDKESLSLAEYREEKSVFNLHFKKKEPIRFRFKDDLVGGEARNRMLLYKPELEKFSVLPFYFTSSYIVGIKFKISSDGFVENPECVLSSGSSEIDHMAIRYIRKWQFVPNFEDQGATVYLNFGIL
jgi:TonB family protein